MDLISAHRQGLADQLVAEARGLTGRRGDHVQRAIVAHHLFDHSGGRHAYALFVAEGALCFEAGIGQMERAARRARWRLGPARSAALVKRVGLFADALATIDAARCEAMWIAYRAAQNEATYAMVPDELNTLRHSDAANLFAAHQGWFETHWGVALEAAIADLAWPLRAAPVATVIGGLRIGTDRFERAARKGLRQAGRSFETDRRLPARFAANPAHHYYALQRAMAAKRREERCRFDDFPLDDSVRLAAAA